VLYGPTGEEVARWGLRECKAGIACDMAWETKQTSDYSSLLPGLVTPANDLLFDSYINKRGLRPDELETLMFDMSARYEALTGRRVVIGFEKAKLEKVMKWFLSEAMKRRDKWLWLKDVNWGTKDKVERIIFRLANRYAQHSIYHRRGMGILENQLIRLRSVAHDDLADCAGMLPEMLSYAPGKEKKEEKKDMFQFLRTQTPLWRDKNNKNYVFGRKERPLPFEVKQGI